MKNLLIAFALLSIFSCSQKKDIKGFNEDAWKSDKNGCEGIRAKMQPQLEAVKNELKALKSDEIISVLGKPNMTKLSTRNQKYFMYNISPSDVCKNYDSNKNINLSIRFNAMGLSYEVIIN